MMEALLSLTGVNLLEGQDRVVRATYTNGGMSMWDSIESVSINLKLNDPIPRYLRVTTADEIWAPTCGDCDGTGWYDGDNRCPNGCPIPASSGSPAPILDAPITWDASADTGPIAWCVAHGSKAALCAAAGRACRAASTFSAPAPLSPVPEDGPRPVDVTALPEWQALVEAVSKAGGRMGARWMMPVGDRAIALVGAARRLAAAADRGGEQQ